MPVKPTYPGVYVQEVPSGVRTIVGVSTSIATFIGRARLGPMNTPTLCLSFSDFERTFTADYADSDLARAVRLFFQNGGTQCYVTRIANGATCAAVTLKAEDGIKDVLTVKAKSAGSAGDSVRLAVTYNGQQPESTFNLEVFRWDANSRGALVKKDTEYWPNLSMDSKSPRYAVDFVNQNSNLLKLELPGTITPAAAGYSLSGRPLADADFADIKALIIGKPRFRMSIDGYAPVDVDLTALNWTGVSDFDGLRIPLDTVITPFLPPGCDVVVDFAAGPDTKKQLKLSSTKGDVLLSPASDKDLAVPLMLGVAQGGIEVSRYAAWRPAPTGLVFNPNGTAALNNLNDFAELSQSAFNKVALGAPSTDIDLANTLETVGSTAKMYKDGYTNSPTGNNDGIREKWAIIVAAINAKASADPTFKWKAEMWGSRLAVIPLDGGDNSVGTVTTTPMNIGTSFTANVRYCSLAGPSLGYQVDGVPGSDGTAPKLTDYRAAFDVIDREVNLFNLMVLPADAGWESSLPGSLWGPASVFCQKRRAFLLMDPPAWKKVQEATNPATGVNGLRIGLVKDYSAIFYPRVTIDEDGLRQNVGPSGAIAGLMARIDASRGVWKAPAGTEADLRGVVGLEYRFSDDENGVLNPHAVNTLRVFPNGIVNWGARTMDGDDDFGSEYKYIPVRRLALFMEESLYRGLKWVVFEPNDEPLWAQIRLNVGAFMHDLFRQGAFQGMTPKDAYFVKCDKETTTQSDINQGMVNIWVGFAPLKPAEFVMLYLKQMAGQIQV